MSLPPLPPHPHQVKSGLERFGVYGTRWAAMAVIGITLLWTVPQRETALPVPVGPQVPLQDSTSGVDVFPVLARVLPGGLPPPDMDRQRQPPCQKHMGEEAFNGYCWLRLDIEPPCPRGQAWERDRKCYARALRVVPVPQSGEVRAGNVAGEP